MKKIYSVYAKSKSCSVRIASIEREIEPRFEGDMTILNSYYPVGYECLEEAEEIAAGLEGVEVNIVPEWEFEKDDWPWDIVKKSKKTRKWLPLTANKVELLLLRYLIAEGRSSFDFLCKGKRCHFSVGENEEGDYGLLLSVENFSGDMVERTIPWDYQWVEMEGLKPKVCMRNIALSAAVAFVEMVNQVK